MKYNFSLEKGKMTEREVRDAIERTTKHVRAVEAQKGKGDVSHEKVREEVVKLAEQDSRKGKI